MFARQGFVCCCVAILFFILLQLFLLLLPDHSTLGSDSALQLFSPSYSCSALKVNNRWSFESFFFRSFFSWSLSKSFFFLIFFQIVQHRPHGLALWTPFQQCLCNCGGDSKPALFPGSQLISHYYHPASFPGGEGFILIVIPVPSDGGLPRVCTGRGYLPRPIVAHILSLDQPAHLVSQGGLIFANMVIMIMKTMISTSQHYLVSPRLATSEQCNTIQYPFHYLRSVPLPSG